MVPWLLALVVKGLEQVVFYFSEKLVPIRLKPLLKQNRGLPRISRCKDDTFLQSLVDGLYPTGNMLFFFAVGILASSIIIKYLNLCQKRCSAYIFPLSSVYSWCTNVSSVLLVMVKDLSSEFSQTELLQRNQQHFHYRTTFHNIL